MHVVVTVMHKLWDRVERMTRRTAVVRAGTRVIRAAWQCYHSRLRPQRLATGVNMSYFLAQVRMSLARAVSPIGVACIMALALSGCMTPRYPAAPSEVASAPWL